MNKYDSLVELDLRELVELEVSEMLDEYHFDSEAITLFMVLQKRNKRNKLK